ncbi:hypothetical protein EON78_00625, partial [bacterium]
MEIPKSLNSVWKNVSQDKVITKQDYELLVKAAAPTGKDEEVDKSEIDFLTKLKSDLEKTGSSKGSIPIEGLNFTEPTPSKVIKESDIGDVPDSLKQSWSKAIEDGNIDQDEYKFLLSVAAPNWSDEELDPKEKAFLGNLQALLKDSGNGVTIAKSEPVKSTSAPEKSPETAQAVTTEAPEVENKGGEAPPAVAKADTETEESLNALNEVNNILEGLGDDPDFAPLKTIVTQRLANSTSAKQFSKDVNDIVSAVEPGKASEAKAKLQTLYDGLPAGVKANPEITNIYTHAKGTIDSQANKKPSAPVSNVPESLKATWDKITSDGKVDSNEYAELLKAASPTGKNEEFDDNELNLLKDVKAKLEANNGIYSFVDSDDSAEVTNQAEAQPTQQTNTLRGASESKPILLNWPGYNSETKGALKKAFGSKVNGTNMPVLAGSEGVKIAKSFGVQNVRELQQLVNAKVDGRFGPETFFKAKVYIANEMNKPDADQNRLNSMLTALGTANDKEIASMRQANGSAPRAAADNATQAQPEDDGVPETLKSTWDQVTADGKLTKAGYEKLISAASPTKKNSEFDDNELKFIAELKGKFEEGQTDVLEVTKPNAAAKPEEPQASSGSIEDSIPATLKSTWNQVTADGKLNKSDYEKLVAAAAPTKKNSEFDNSELEFLATVKKMFDENDVDELEVSKPKTQTKPVNSPQPQKPTQSSGSIEDSIPSTLKSTWKQVTADGKLTKADYEKLISAASPTKKNSEFDN